MFSIVGRLVPHAPRRAPRALPLPPHHHGSTTHQYSTPPSGISPPRPKPTVALTATPRLPYPPLSPLPEGLGKLSKLVDMCLVNSSTSADLFANRRFVRKNFERVHQAGPANGMNNTFSPG